MPSSKLSLLLDYSYDPKFPSGELPYPGPPGHGSDTFLASLTGSHKHPGAEYLSRVADPTKVIHAHLWDSEKGSLTIAFDLLDPKSAEAASTSKYVTENWTPIGPKSPKLLRSISSFISSIELEAHSELGGETGLLSSLGRAEGGTSTTQVEPSQPPGTAIRRTAHLGTGALGHTETTLHTSPTRTAVVVARRARSRSVSVGLKVTKPSGREWQPKHMFEGLSAVEAGFITALGKFRGRWLSGWDKGCCKLRGTGWGRGID
ncbi:hypothetical protein DL768_000181 [Monosporascus sp. mg162]|nr:hypothetical protein DL768_000181 [Monosporascus sp. mg162]